MMHVTRRLKSPVNWDTVKLMWRNSTADKMNAFSAHFVVGGSLTAITYHNVWYAPTGQNQKKVADVLAPVISNKSPAQCWTKRDNNTIRNQSYVYEMSGAANRLWLCCWRIRFLKEILFCYSCIILGYAAFILCIEFHVTIESACAFEKTCLQQHRMVNHWEGPSASVGGG